MQRTKERSLTSTDERVDALLRADGPNELVRVEGVQSTGQIQRMDKTELRIRRETLSRLLHTGLSDDKIRDEMEVSGYKMDKKTFQRLKKDLFARWNTEDKERAPYLKSAARRRMYEEIDEARKEKQYNAVASFEKTLATVEGTSTEKSATEPAGARQINAIIMILGDMKPEDAMKYVAEEVKRQPYQDHLDSDSTISVTPSK